MTGTDDDTIWQAYAKSVKPIGRKRKDASVTPAKAGLQKSKPPATAKKLDVTKIVRREKPPASANPKPDQFMTVPLDRNIERRLRQGEVAIDARLDLHGMHQAQAHKALDEFVATQIKRGSRSLLIITGKGRGGEGILRANLAHWLSASLHAPRILALRPASPQHGGAGAFYVLLRKGKH